MLRLALFVPLVFTFVSPPASAQVSLQFKIDQPAEYVVETTTAVDQTLTLAGMDLETEAISTEHKRLTLGKRDGEGNALLRVKTERVQSKLSLPGGITFEFDSAADEQPEANPALAPLVTLLKASANVDVTFAIDSSGKVVSVTGLEKLLEAIPVELRTALGDQVSKKSAIRNLQQEVDRLPKDPVKPGDFWERSIVFDAGSGQLLTFARRYEYVGTVEEGGKTLDKISVTDTAIDFTMAENSPLALGLKDSDLEIKSSAGETLFDRDAGRDVKNHYKTQVTGSLTFVANGQELPAELDLTIDITSQEVE
jgi:hypothetical protein